MWPVLAQNSGVNVNALLKSFNILRYGLCSLSLHLPCSITPFLRDYDIIHCQYGSMGNFGALLKELGVKGKLVTTFHGTDIRDGIAQGGRIYKDLFDRCDCILAISDYNARHLIGFGLDKKKLTFHPVGVELPRFPFKWKTAVRPDDGTLRVLSVGRLVAEKGYEIAIVAIAQVKQKNPDLNLLYDIIGDGPLRPKLEALIYKNSLEDIVRLHGPRTQDQVAAALQRSDIFLLSSIAEALPVALMESQATGLPAIATAVGSTDQIVLSGTSGFIVPAGDASAIAEKISFLARHPHQWRKMGEAGRHHIEKNFDLDRLNDRLVDLYHRLAARC
jgi:colanic acid/amylovoran biosynthesis glycosyltransferase